MVNRLMKSKFRVLLWCVIGTFLFLPGHIAPVSAQQVKQSNTLHVHAQAYQPIADLWTKHMNETGAIGRTWVGPIMGNGVPDRLHKHGHRHTIIYVPSQYNPAQPTQLLIWLHGHNGFNKFGDRILRHVDARFKRGDNIIVIAVEQPWSHWTKTRTSRNGTGPFRRPGEFETWMSYVFNILKSYGVPVQRISPRNVTLYGHSAGGSGIKSMALSGALEILQPGKIVFSDSTYGRWFDVVYDKFLKQHPDTHVYVLTKKWGPPWKSMVRFYRERRNISPNIKHIALSRGWSHKRIGDNCLLYPETPF